MAVISTSNPTLIDHASRTDANGNIATIVELLDQSNAFVEDMASVEANETMSHKTTVRTGLPEPTWRELYGGVQPTKSTTAQVVDSIGNLEAYAEVDQQLADLNGNTMQFRMSEDVAHIEGMGQSMESTVIYGNSRTEGAKFLGLAPRYNSLSAQNKDNIISAGGVGSDNTSIWLVVSSPRTIHSIFPKGSSAGLSSTDKGQVTIENVDGFGGRMEAYRTHYVWRMGLCVRDWRYAVRICNIDVNDLSTLANTKNIIEWMTRATERIPNLNAGRAAFYMNRTLRESLRLGILEKTASNLTWDTVSGKRVLAFDGIPVRRCDALLNTEAVVS